MKDNFIYSGEPDSAAYALRQKDSIEKIKADKKVEKQDEKKS